MAGVPYMLYPLVVCLIIVFVCGEKNIQLKKLVRGSRTSEEDVRVSWKECNLVESERQDCGFYGVSEEQCYARECCWGESKTEGVPWCYHAKAENMKLCLASPEERLECGFYGIRKEQCLALECCWRPVSAPEAPFCFHRIRFPVYEGECGVPSIPPNVLARVVGGTEAKPHSWPWMASLQHKGRHVCGGSLINNQWVLSAAHCEIPIAVATVILGLHSQSEHDSLQQTFGVEELIIHELYGTEGYFGMAYDAMLIKLNATVEFNDHISPVCLTELDNEVPGGKRAYITGWGTLRYQGDGPDKLQQAMTPVVSHEQCNVNDSYGGRVDDTMMCAGFEEGGRGGCHGDSGGPLVIYEDDHWAVAGIASWVGVEWTGKCAGSNYPTVYCRVAKFVRWIEDTIVKHS